MLEHWRESSAAELETGFRWNLPARFNIGVECSDRQPAGRLAMLHVERDGTAGEHQYGGLTKDSNRLANALRSFGVKAGDRVCVALPQHPNVAISHLAIYKLGAIAVPMTTLFGPDAFLYRLADSATSIMITDEGTATKIAPLRDQLPALREVLVVESEWSRMLEKASPHFTAVDTLADDPALLIYTSGTTGEPKGALHAHRVLLGHLPGFELSHNFYGRRGDRFWTPADWAWIGGLYDGLFPVLFHGSSILSFATDGKFDPERALLMMSRYGVRNTFLPPTSLKLIRQLEMTRVRRGPRLRTVMSGGEPLGQEVLEWGHEALGVTINEIYGQTEANYVVGNCSQLYAVRPGSMGKAYPGHSVTVLDEAGTPTDSVGEIAITRPDPVMFLGYWNKEAETSGRYTHDWMRTGDMARLDSDGYFWFQGRNDDLINSSGYRIGPTEIESTLMTHPAIAMAAVVGVADSLRGQIVKAFLVVRPGWTGDSNLRVDVQNHVRTRLAAYEYPREIEFVDELPLTTTGKIRRAELRALARN